jgi:hypothetical protein
MLTKLAGLAVVKIQLKPSRTIEEAFAYYSDSTMLNLWSG